MLSCRAVNIYIIIMPVILELSTLKPLTQRSNSSLLHSPTHPPIHPSIHLFMRRCLEHERCKPLELMTTGRWRAVNTADHSDRPGLHGLVHQLHPLRATRPGRRAFHDEKDNFTVATRSNIDVRFKWRFKQISAAQSNNCNSTGLLQPPSTGNCRRLVAYNAVSNPLGIDNSTRRSQEESNLSVTSYWTSSWWCNWWWPVVRVASPSVESHLTLMPIVSYNIHGIFDCYIRGCLRQFWTVLRTRASCLRRRRIIIHRKVSYSCWSLAVSVLVTWCADVYKTGIERQSIAYGVGLYAFFVLMAHTLQRETAGWRERITSERE